MLADLEAQLAAAIALQVRLGITPPTIAVQLEIAIALVAALRAAIALGLPGVDFQIAACATLILRLRAEIAVLAGLNVAFGTAGVQAYVYDGSAASFGPTVASTVGPGLPGGAPSDHVDALVLATSVPAVWAAMGKVFVQ
jgi:hypothetical protein